MIDGIKKFALYAAAEACRAVSENPRRAATTTVALSALSLYTGRGVTASMVMTATTLGVVTTSSGTGIFWPTLCAGFFAGWSSLMDPAKKSHTFSSLWSCGHSGLILIDDLYKVSSAIALGILAAYAPFHRGVNALIAAGAMGLGAYAWVKSNGFEINSLSVWEGIFGSAANAGVDKMRRIGIFKGNPQIILAVQKCPANKRAQLSAAYCRLYEDQSQDRLLNKAGVIDAIVSRPQFAETFCNGLFYTKKASFFSNTVRWRILPLLCRYPMSAETLAMAWHRLAENPVDANYGFGLRNMLDDYPDHALAFSYAWSTYRINNYYDTPEKSAKKLKELETNIEYIFPIGRVLGRLIGNDHTKNKVGSSDLDRLLKHASRIDEVFPPSGQAFEAEVKIPLTRDAFERGIASLSQQQ